MIKVISYSGQEPKVIPSEQTDKMLDIMAKQLDILLQMATTIVITPAGSALRLENIGDD